MNVTVVNLLQSYCCPVSPDSNARVERLSEFSLHLVQQCHFVRNTIKRQCPRLIVNINPYPGGPGHRYSRAFAVVHERVFGFRAVQTPRLVVPSKAARFVISFPLDPFVGDSDVHFSAAPVQLPVISSSSQTRLTQCLLPVVEAVRMIWVRSWLIAHLNHSVSIRQEQVWMGC